MRALLLVRRDNSVRNARVCVRVTECRRGAVEKAATVNFTTSNDDDDDDEDAEWSGVVRRETGAADSANEAKRRCPLTT